MSNNHNLICSRCNGRHNKKCDRDACNFDEYYQAMNSYFPDSIPKYFCTVTGGINAGKTFYLLSLINLLTSRDEKVRKIFSEHGIDAIKIIDPISQRTRKELLNQCRLGRLEYTNKVDVLSYFNLVIYPYGKEPFELLLFNTSGEKLEEIFRDWDLGTEIHELKGAAIMHFIDPREDSGLNSRIENPKDVVNSGKCKDHNFMDFMEELNHRMGDGRTNIGRPVAVCISKFDLLDQMALDIPQPVYVDVSKQDYSSDQNFSSTNLRDFLENYSVTANPKRIEAAYSNVSYFGVAPYGVDDEVAVWDKRKPRGVLAPFFWILKEFL